MGEVNNVSGGTGGGRATDGNWSPPEQHPSYVAPDTSQESAPEAESIFPSASPLAPEQPDELAAYSGLTPGWYRDPSNSELARYWDGTKLSEQTQPVSGAGAQSSGRPAGSAAPAAAAASAQGAEERTRRTGLVVVLGIVALCVAIGTTVFGPSANKGNTPSPIAASGDSTAPLTTQV